MYIVYILFKIKAISSIREVKIKWRREKIACLSSIRENLTVQLVGKVWRRSDEKQVRR
jgi:hypothetical protein